MLLVSITADPVVAERNAESAQADQIERSLWWSSVGRGTVDQTQAGFDRRIRWYALQPKHSPVNALRAATPKARAVRL